MAPGPEDLQIQLAHTRAQLEALTQDVGEIKDELRKITEILVRLSNVQAELSGLKEELTANARSHDQIWQEITKLRDNYLQFVQSSLPLLEWTKNMRKSISHLTVALISTAAVSIVGWLIYLYSVFGK
jgi:chromosome segregation ATPase